MNSKKEKKQEWPYIRWAKEEGQWKVDARTKDGGSRRFFKTKTEAETFAQQCRVQKVNSGISAFGNAELSAYGKTVHDAIAFYLAHLRSQAKSIAVDEAMLKLIATRRAAGRDAEYLRGLSIRLGRFSKDHPRTSVASFTPGDLNKWISALPHAPATRNTFRRDLVTLFSYCRDHGYCESNPAARTDIVTDDEKPAGILTPAQTEALLSHCGNDLIPYVAIGIFAGLRVSELQKLDWSKVDVEGGHIEVTAKKAKTRRRRLVPISECLSAWIRPLARPAGPVAPIGLRKRFEAVRKAAGLEEWPNNALRHSYGSYRLAQCHDAARVSLEMGNSPAIVFAHYRELVKPKDAELFWSIVPDLKQGP